LTISIDYINVFGECKFCSKLLIRTDPEVLELKCGHYFHYPCMKEMLINLFGEIPNQAQVCHSCAFCDVKKEEDRCLVSKHRLDDIFKEDLDEKFFHHLQDGLVDGEGGYEYNCSMCSNFIIQGYGQSNKYFKLDCEHGFCRKCIIPIV